MGFLDWHNKAVEDDGAYVSDDFKDFCKDLRAYLKKTVARKGWTLDTFSPSHYDVSGFLVKDNKYIYFSYSVPRGEINMDFNRHDAMCGVLIRTADSNSDYSGGSNHFTSWYNFEDEFDSVY